MHRRFSFGYLPLGYLYAPADAGAGSSGVGSTAGQVDGQRGTSYDTGGQRGTGSGQASGGTPYELKDDSLILHEGKPVKWSEHRAAHFVPKTEYDKISQSFGSSRQLLTDYAKRLDEGFAALDTERKKLGKGGQQQQAQQVDIADEIAGMPIVDGATAARLVKTLREQGLGPIAQVVTQQQTAIKALTEEIKAIRGTAGTLAEHHQSQEFESHVAEALTKVGEIKGLPADIPLPKDNATLKAIASDLWLSYDPKTWKLPDYHRMLNERLSGMVALVRELDKQAIAGAQEKKRKFFNPTAGRAQPSGQQGYKHMSGRDIAKESGLWDRSQSHAA